MPSFIAYFVASCDDSTFQIVLQGYIAPENIIQGVVSIMVDTYSLGVIIIEIQAMIFGGKQS